MPSRCIVIFNLLPRNSADTVRHERSGDRLPSINVIFKFNSPSNDAGIFGSVGVSRKYDNAFVLLLVLYISREFHHHKLTRKKKEKERKK